MEEETVKKMDRRDFIKGVALVGGTAAVAAAGLAGCTKSGADAAAERTWDEEHDVVSSSSAVAAPVL